MVFSWVLTHRTIIGVDNVDFGTLNKMMIAKRSNRWIDMIPHALKLYHNTEHSSIKMTPHQAEMSENQNNLREIHVFLEIGSE